jgi:hypothetical protein
MVHLLLAVTQKIRQKFQKKLMVMAWECPDGSKLIFTIVVASGDAYNNLADG